jgi:hypothetical protein
MWAQPLIIFCYFSFLFIIIPHTHKKTQHDVPPGKHALITVKQPKGNLVWIMAGVQTQQTKTTEKEKVKPKLQTWNECDVVQVGTQVDVVFFFTNHIFNRILLQSTTAIQRAIQSF